MSVTYDLKREFLSAFRSLMTPLVRILLRNGITFRELAEVLRDVFVSVAAREGSEAGRPVTLARIAISTGLTRKEISSIVRDEHLRRRARETNASRAARVLEVWHSDPRFMGPYGFPRDLPVEGPDPAGTFEQLVRDHGGQVPTLEMLDVLVRVGAARVLEGGRTVRVLKRTYIPTEMTPEMIQIFTQAVRRYVETVDFNLSLRDTKERRLERVVYPDLGLRPEDVDAFQREIREYLETVIAEIDYKSSRYRQPDSEHGESSVKLGVGMYFYRDEPEDKRTIAEVLGNADASLVEL
jgi:hypothetical protein